MSDTYPTRVWLNRAAHDEYLIAHRECSRYIDKDQPCYIRADIHDALVEAAHSARSALDEQRVVETDREGDDTMNGNEPYYPQTMTVDTDGERFYPYEHGLSGITLRAKIASEQMAAMLSNPSVFTTNSGKVMEDLADNAVHAANSLIARLNGHV